MTGTTPEFLAGQLGAYTESWQRGHADALACWELEARLEVALALFHVVRRVDEEMARQVAAGQLVWDARAIDQIRQFYRLWEAPTASVLRRVDDLSAKGFVVDRSDDFTRAALQARATLSIPLDRLDESARQARDGAVRPLGEIRDELHDQSHH
jgi:hypothetical protein